MIPVVDDSSYDHIFTVCVVLGLVLSHLLTYMKLSTTFQQQSDNAVAKLVRQNPVVDVIWW